MRRYDPDGPIRPCGSPRSALGPPPPATRIAGARRRASIQIALAEAAAPARSIAPRAGGPSPSAGRRPQRVLALSGCRTQRAVALSGPSPPGESQARDHVPKQALAGGQPGLGELAHDLDGRGDELRTPRRANGAAGEVGLGFEALSGY